MTIVDFAELLADDDTLAASAEMKKYHHTLKLQVKEALEIATNAKLKGFDPKKEVEIYIAQDVASRTEGLVGPPGIAKRLKELENDYTKDQIVVKIAQEIARGEFSNGEMQTIEELADQALRTALSYQTEGITAAPIEGISKVRLKPNLDGNEYLAIYYAGPIRSAGGTAQGVSVIIADIIRETLELARYEATPNEVERMLEEVRLYNKIMHLQLPTSDDEIRHAWKNIPVMITGDPTEKEEVGGYRDIESMDSNRVRGGACLVLNDGLVGRAKKITKRIKKLNLDGWNWLEEIAAGKYTDSRETDSKEGGKPTKVTPDYSFASDALMGRPTFSDATEKGGFRLRYGHARNTGIAGIGVHPGTMAAVKEFLATGTHIRTERPGKGSIVAPIDSIKPPVVLLKNGDVVEFDNFEENVKIIDEIKEVLFIGDQLIGIGEFFQNNYRLVPPGWNEEWWALQMMKAGWQGKNKDENDYQFFNRMYYNPPGIYETIELAKEYDVALHPKYTPAWIYITPQEVEQLRLELWKADGTTVSTDVKKILEKSLILHKVCAEGLDLGELIKILRLQLPDKIVIDDLSRFDSGLSLVQQVSPVKIKDIMGTTIGSRMGRPEKAKARLMKPQLNGLFPLGSDKKIKRLLSNAIEKGEIQVFLGNRYCTSCNKGTYNAICKECGNDTIIRGKCKNPRCRADMDEGPCDICGSNISFTRPYTIDMNDYMKDIYSKIDRIPAIVRLKDQIKNPLGIPEIMEKGILRARYNLNVFRDGTIRYDATDAPLTHFYPKEAKVSLEKLKELGYATDIIGDNLINENQLLEIKPQDIILHTSSYKHLRDVANFVDDELELIYKMPRYYNIESPQDLVGHLVIGLAPHTSAGVIGRVIGFTDSSVCWAHPFWHSSKRRNCVDYNEELIVYNEQTEQIQKIVIGEFIENLIDEGLPFEVVDDFNTKAIKNPFQHLKSLSISESSLEPILNPIKNWILGSSDEWVTVTTKSGSRLRMTGNHQQLVWNENTNQLIRKNAIDLDETDILISRSSLPGIKENEIKSYNILQEFSEKLPNNGKFNKFKDQVRLRESGEHIQQFFIEYIMKKKKDATLKNKPRVITKYLRQKFDPVLQQIGSKSFTKRWYNSIPLSHLEVFVGEGVLNWDDIPINSKIGLSRNDQLVPVYLELTNELFRFIGLLLSEGYIRDDPGCYQVNISLPHSDLKDETIQLSESIMGNSYFKEDNDQVVNANKIIAYLFAYAWKIGKNALDKRIPDFIYSLPHDFRLRLLEGIIDGDGSLIISTRALQIYTANQSLASDYRLLISSLGYSGTIIEVVGQRFGETVLNNYKKLGKEPSSNGVLYHVKTNGFETISLSKELKLHHPQKQANIKNIISNDPPKYSKRKHLNSHYFLDNIKSIQIERKSEPAYCVEIGDNSSKKYDHNITLLNAPVTGQCDGDEDGVVLLLDGFINFSKEYLPTTRGSKMDTPLVLVVTLNPNEVDDEAFNLDSMISYPLEFYEAASAFELPSTLGAKIHRAEQRLGKPEQYEGYSYSHPTSNISEGPRTSRYKDHDLDIRAKLDLQLNLAKIIRAVEAKSTALRILEKHVLPDLMGNLRAFASQQVRCVTCNTKYRRVPLAGKCKNKECPKSNIILTVPPRGVSKYYDICKRLVKDYDLGVYHENRLERIKIALDSHFPETKQVTFDLADWLS